MEWVNLDGMFGYEYMAHFPFFYLWLYRKTSDGIIAFYNVNDAMQTGSGLETSG